MPDHVNGILASIQNISDEARRILADPELLRAKQLSSIGVRLSSINALPAQSRPPQYKSILINEFHLIESNS